jgi:predicted DNA-binding protein with PD1-like motif
MNVREARRTRHLVIRLDRGDEIPAALVRALDAAEARSAFIQGVGALEAAEVAIFDQASKTYARTRRIEGGCEALHLTGNAASMDGATTLRLSAVLAREGDVGLSTFGGQLVWARVYEMELDVTVLDDVTLSRTADERTGLPVLTARPAAANAIPAAEPAPVEAKPPPPVAAPPPVEAKPPPPVAAPAPLVTPPPVVAPPPPVAAPPPPPPPPPPSPVVAPRPATVVPPAAQPVMPVNPVMPQRPMKPKDDLEIYPEAGDRVMHFHFGECTVVSSDGDRIRLQQDRDGRVREVALTMLKIDPPESTAEGKRRFKLGRKH